MMNGALRNPLTIKTHQSDGTIVETPQVRLQCHDLDALPDDHLLTSDATAELLNVKPDTLGKMRQRLKGPTFLEMSPRKHLYRVKDVRCWMADHGILGQKYVTPKQLTAIFGGTRLDWLYRILTENMSTDCYGRVEGYFESIQHFVGNGGLETPYVPIEFNLAIKAIREISGYRVEREVEAVDILSQTFGKAKAITYLRWRSAVEKTQSRWESRDAKY